MTLVTESTDRWDRVKAALEAAVEHQASDRVKFLERLCGHDRVLFEEVRSLLETYDDDFLESPVAPVSLASLSEPATPLDSGPRKIGAYTVVEKVGAGGMGEVYKVVDEEGRIFALKRLIRELVSEEGLLRLRREASAASALEHPNIVHFVTLVEHEDGPHIVMEYLDGQTLKKLLAGGRRLDLSSAVLVAIQVAEALQCAHEKGIVHRDLKPGNILLTSSSQVKLLDFGIAKMLAVAPGAGLSPQERLTKSGEILGTKGYMAPEQSRGEPVDARADVFSFGCVVYQMLCGKSAFSGHNALDRYVAIVSEDPPRLKQRQPLVPDELDELVHRCLSKDPEDRPKDMAEMLAVLRRVDA
jgi:serine/threonine protein kinase